MKEAIKAVSLAYTYSGVDDTPDVVVFEDLDLTIEEGTFVAILGSNGCGKSTLAKHFNSILLPSGGKVWVCGMDTSNEDRLIAIRRSVGMVFQNPDNQIVATVVEEDVAFGCENLGIPSAEIRRRVDAALEAVGMTKYARHSPHKLSGGQKQRVAIAGIIAMKPQCIVFDEPTAMLDPRGRREVMKTAKMLNEEYGITVIFITHYMDEAVKAKRVIVMDEGRIILDGTPKEVFVNVDTLKKAKLDVPEATELTHLLIKDGINLNKDILDIDELADAIVNIMEAKN